MTALEIVDVRKLMSAFLVGTLFDEYALVEAQIRSFCTFSIDGRYERLFDEAEEGGAEEKGAVSEGAPASYVRWARLKEKCFGLIKGKKTPLSFKFIFFYPPEKLPAFLQASGSPFQEKDVAGLCINLHFDGKRLILTTGTSLKIFSMDRTLEQAWDEAVIKMLSGIDVQTAST